MKTPRIIGWPTCGLLLALSTAALAQPDLPNTQEFMPPPIVPPSIEVTGMPKLKQDAAGYWEVGFQHLASFPFGRHKFEEEPFGRKHTGRLALLVPDESNAVVMPTEPGTSGTIPAQIQALDGKRVRISGYMLPIRTENGLVRECLLLRNQSLCCFGRRPELNEWVVVKMKGRGVPSKMDTPVTFFGTLHVGELFENNVFEGLYLLDGEKISTE